MIEPIAREVSSSIYRGSSTLLALRIKLISVFATITMMWRAIISSAVT